MTENNNLQKIELKINGTHCTACEVLIERKFKKMDGVEQCKVNYATGRAQLYCSRTPSTEELERVIRPHGYSINSTVSMATKKDYIQISAVFLIVVALYLILKQFHLVPDNFGVSEGMSYGLVFVIGLVAAVSTCMAVSGGLLLAVAAKFNEQHPDLTGIQKFRPHLYFNAGRVVSYTVLGGVVGALGSVLSLSSRLNGIVIALVSVVMIIMGLQLLKIFPWLSRFQLHMPKFIAHRIYRASEGKQGKLAPFLFGAATFFMPCGFTQALQLYVLANGNFITGALTMLVFSLGTLPALMSVSAIMSFTKGAFQRYFIKFAGVVVVLMGIFNISNGLALAGVHVVKDSSTYKPLSANQGKQSATSDPNVQMVNGVQVVKMAVVGYEYQPARFTVTAGVPVEWQIDGSRAAGCAQVITVPGLKLTEFLPKNQVKTIHFIPSQAGTLSFSCTMGMTTPGAAFTVVQNTGATPSQDDAQIQQNTPPPADCDPTVMVCDPNLKSRVQKLNMVIDRNGFYPTTFTVKKGIPVELEIDTQVKLGGCMSTMVIPDYQIAHQLTFGKSVVQFTPTKAGTVPFTCSMGSRQGQFEVVG